MDGLSELYQEVIMDHNRKPRNFHAMEDATAQADGHNPLCGDKFTVWLRVEDGKVGAATFEGVGCAISKSSASLMTETLKGRSVDDARELSKQFHALITRDGKPDMDRLGKLKVFEGVGEFPARVKCAMLAWRTVDAALAGDEAKVSTE